MFNCLLHSCLVTVLLFLLARGTRPKHYSIRRMNTVLVKC